MDVGALRARIGTALRGKWVLERLLGYGGMAAVYVARHRIGRLEAVKILHKHLLTNRELLVRFEREARVANHFKHPGAIQITDVDVAEDGCPFLVMELAEGATLADIARQRKLQPLEILAFADQVLDVLATAHPMGIIHRDIKPGNLVLQTDGRVRVLDFGVAKIEGSTFTEQGATVGTASYMPPEQVRGESIDGRVDLFAVGATMFRLLTGRQLREGNAGEVLFQAATMPAPRLFDVLPDASSRIAAVVDKALAFEAADRYQDAREMQADVRSAARALAENTFDLPADTVVNPAPLAVLQFAPYEAQEHTSVTPYSGAIPSAQNRSTIPLLDEDDELTTALPAGTRKPR